MNFRMWAWLLVLPGFCFFPVSLAASQYTPNQVKAVYLYRIASFIQWDNEQDMDSVRFCVVGNEEIKSTLEVITKGKKIRDLELEVVTGISSYCNVAFLSSNMTSKEVSEHSSSIVTVSDIKGFTKQGGIIELQEVGTKVRPLINLGNSKEGPFSIGSRLLRVSKVEENAHAVK